MRALGPFVVKDCPETTGPKMMAIDDQLVVHGRWLSRTLYTVKKEKEKKNSVYFVLLTAAVTEQMQPDLTQLVPNTFRYHSLSTQVSQIVVALRRVACSHHPPCSRS
jgi:hypothetical protein